ncbi:phosphatidate cytidylyltransferase [bacterium endosymbiont of Pedicinus badii]|uniref:phosphatidate cytidylyltransferase n=1 Tax=bacterium endosymbiont of Pedicinus badii TaxID=1719126 RepID=UPI0018A7EB71|nr:phosphatidate cytidylyltransferase [bacterium endosymbiont of Pedicinus badii]
MFIKRTITSIFGIFATLSIIIYADSVLFSFFISLICSIGMFEWIKLCSKEKEKIMPFFLFYLFFLIIVFIILYKYPFFYSLNKKYFFILNSFLFTISMLFVSKIKKFLKIFEKKNLKILLGILIIINFFYSITNFAFEYKEYKIFFIYMLTIIWCMDTFSYIVGSLLGKIRICPNVSPNKTYEGLLGGIFLTEIVNLVLKKIVVFSHERKSFISVFLILIVSFFGDIFISKIKRIKKVKNSGSIFPGHGGVLDRIDSILCTFPIVINFMYF